MTSIKVKFKPSSVVDHEGTIFYQIIHERKQRQLFTPYHIFSSEWDESCSMVTIQRSKRKSFILYVREKIHLDVERLAKIIRQLDNTGLAYSSDNVIEEYHRFISEYSLFNYMESIIIKLKQSGKVRTSETYTSALISFKKFLVSQATKEGYAQDENPMLDSITSDIMQAYGTWLAQRRVLPNTISFYTRILRAVYNRAVEQGVIENRNPFRYVYTGVDKTTKRALPLATVKKIKDLDLSFNPSLDYARDMFLLSFMLRGMSFIDMAFLKKSDLKNGSIIYRRRKTGQRMVIGWTKEMQKILDKYPINASEYLLPIITSVGADERVAYRKMGHKINYDLKKIAKIIGVNISLTLYVARHSWASVAKAQGIPLSVISEGMGHDSESTTQIYLASLDTSVVDKANLLILNSLN